MADLAPQLIAAIKGDKGFYPDVDYSAAKSYRKDTVLKYNGSQWRALQIVPAGTTPAEGAYWTKFIDGTPIADAAQVAADRALSQAAAATAAAMQSSVSTLALQVAGDKAASQIAAQSAVAVSGLANFGATFSSLMLDPNTIAVFEYDTRRDIAPAGVDWTRLLNNSLINEPLNTANRGVRKDCPTLLMLLATTTAFYIFDGDDPAGSMWVKFVDGGIGATSNAFNGGALSVVTSISAKNGVINVTTSNGNWIIDLIGDTVVRAHSGVTATTGLYLGTLAERNAGKGFDGGVAPYLDGGRVIPANASVNHSALEVLPNTRSNPNRFGLPNPMIALATEGGSTIIRPDGAVVNSANTAAVKRVAIAEDLTFYAKLGGGDTNLQVYSYPSYMVASFPVSLLNGATVPATMYNVGTVGNNSAITALRNGDVAFGANVPGGFSVLRRNRGALNQSWMNYTSQWINTGWISPNAKMALVESSKLLAPLTGATKFSDNFSDNDVSDWTPSGGATLSGAGAELTVTVGGTSTYNAANMTISGLTIGQFYTVDFKYKRSGTHSARLGINDTGTPGLVIASAATVSTTYVLGRIQFFALSTSIKMMAMVDHPTPTLGNQAMFKDIVVREVAGDRSATNVGVAGNCADIVGTVNRVPIAPGAELAGYSGFFANTSHLSVPNTNGALNLGNGDFCVRLVTFGLNSDHALMHFTDQVGTAGQGSGVNANWYLNTAAGALRWFGKDTAGVSFFSDAMPFSAAGLNHIVLNRRGNRFETYVNGSLALVSTNAVASLSNSAASLVIGAMFYNGILGLRGNGTIALVDIGGAALMPEEIKRRAVDELAMCQGKILLQGGYIVQDLFEDRDTGLLYVAKSAGGTDIFQGFSNKGTILSTGSVNKFVNSGLSGATIGGGFGGTTAPPATAGGISMALVAVGAGYIDIRVSGTATATGAHSWGLQNTSVGAPQTVAAPGEQWTFSLEEQLIAGSMTGLQHTVRLDRLTTAGALVSTAGSTTITPSGVNARSQVSVTAEATTGQLIPKFVFNWNNGAAIDATIRVRRPQTEKAAAFTAFVDGLSGSDNHKSVSASDGHVIIGTGNGADIVMPALPLRSGVRGRRGGAGYDPGFSTFNGRVTSDATPTNVGNPFHVPEGGKVHFVVNISGAVPGGTASERITRPVIGYAYRDIGAANALVVIPTGGIPTDKTTGAMDAGVVAGAGGWVFPYGTGKAATVIEWYGDQKLTRAAA